MHERSNESAHSVGVGYLLGDIYSPVVGSFFFLIGVLTRDTVKTLNKALRVLWTITHCYPERA